MRFTWLLAATFSGLLTHTYTQASIESSGYVEAELRAYPSKGLLDGQDDLMPSAAIAPEITWTSASEAHDIRYKGFGRYSNRSGHRDHADIRELYYAYNGTGWQIEAGINKVYWGVVESAHLVDIINQTDNVESITGEEKLGQPMISLGFEDNWGNLDFYILPYFRERSFTTGPERFQIAINGQAIYYDEDSSIYESDEEDKHIDLAARWSSSIGNMDIALSYFNGTERAPIPILSNFKVPFSSILADPTAFNINQAIFSSYYEQVEKFGLELQYLYEDWAFKYEGISHAAKLGDYHASVIGFEFTLSDLDSWGQDVGILVEYLWNDREAVSTQNPSLAAILPIAQQSVPGISFNDLAAAIPASSQQQFIFSGDTLSPFNNDLFIGTRFTLNDMNSTDFLAGAIIDLDDQTITASFEGGTRIGNNTRVSVNVYLFENIDKQSVFYSSRKDDQIEAKIAWYY